MPLAPTSGWHGSLPPGSSTGLRDNATIKVRAGTALPPVVQTPVPVQAQTPVPPSQAIPYAGYSYSYGGTANTGQYRPAATGTSSYASQYKPAQGATYYQSAYVAPTQQAQSGQGSYYGSQAYSGAGATGQQPYSGYTSWYGGYTAPAAATQAAGRTSTPQPAAPTYGGFFNAAATTGTTPAASATPPLQRTAAVANTVVGKQAWNTGSGVYTPHSAVPTLPAHLRNANGGQNGGQNGQQQQR